MSFQKPTHPYWAKRREACMMKPATLTLVKGILFSVIMGVVVIVSIVENTGQIRVLAFIIAVLLVFGIEVNEIRLGNFLIDFPGTGEENQDDEGSNDDE